MPHLKVPKFTKCRAPGALIRGNTVVKKQLEELVNHKHSEKNSLYMNSLKEIEYIREESRAKNLKKKKKHKNLNVIDVMNNTYHDDEKQYKCNK